MVTLIHLGVHNNTWLAWNSPNETIVGQNHLWLNTGPQIFYPGGMKRPYLYLDLCVVVGYNEFKLRSDGCG